MAAERWTENETKLALFLYFQLPFGKLDRRTPEIIQLADAIGRTHSSVAMKLSNFASLDPKITESGRKGLDGASKLDRQIFEKFVNDWSGLVEECERKWNDIIANNSGSSFREAGTPFQFQAYNGPTSEERLVDQRIGQSFFRKSVLANFGERCCITGIADPQLINASHIVPWAEDLDNRVNPRNGIALSPTLDRAFDRGFMTIDAAGTVIISDKFMQRSDEMTRNYFSAYDRKTITPPMKIQLDPKLLEWHMTERFEN